MFESLHIFSLLSICKCKCPSTMLSARLVTVFIFLFFSLGNLMPGKHLLIETESGDGENGEATEPQGEGEVVK